MKAIVVCGFSLMVLIMCTCKKSPTLDFSKLDTTYFVGEYESEYRNEVEKINLKENGKYDYVHGKNNDTIIKDAGVWEFNKEGEFLYIEDFPNVRKNKVYEEKKEMVFDMQLGIDNVSDLGNLYTIDHEESRYTFVKLDKSRNKDYLLKTEK
jgi:hypothetical protein